MKIPKTTLILVFIALGLGSFVYFHEIRGANRREEIAAQQKQIFSFNANDIQSLTIKTKNNTLQLERRNSSDKPEWSIKSPITEPANDAIVSYLTDLLVKGKNERTLSITPKEIKEFGLDQPQATIDIKLKNQQSYQIILGKSDFNNRFLYAQTDPKIQPDGKINVLLVSTDFQNAVNRDLSEWKNISIENPSTPLPTIPLTTPLNQNTSTPSPNTPQPTPLNQNTSTPSPNTPQPTPTNNQTSKVLPNTTLTTSTNQSTSKPLPSTKLPSPAINK